MENTECTSEEKAKREAETAVEEAERKAKHEVDEK